MTYAEYKETTAYKKTKSGAMVDIRIFLESDPTNEPIGRGTGLTWNENYEQNPVEEYGNDGIDEYVDGKHSGSFSIDTFFIPEQNDKMITRTNFHDKIYTILEVSSDKWPNPGVVLSALTGCKFSGRGVTLSARGLMGDRVNGVYTNRYSGEEYESLT